MNEKGFANLLIGIVIATVIVIGTGSYYFFISKQETPSEGVDISLSQTSESTPEVPSRGDAVKVAPPPPPKIQIPASSPSLKTYLNDSYRFEVKFSPSLIPSFEAIFKIEETPNNYICQRQVYDKSDQSYDESYNTFNPALDPDCKAVFEPFEKYVQTYVGDEPPTKTFIKTRDGTPAYIIYSEIPITDINTGVTTVGKFYYVLVEGRGKLKAMRGLRFDPTAASLICPDKICALGEARGEGSTYCPADCPAARDFGKILEEIFATFRFL